MLTMLDDDESVRAALAAGASGNVLKGDSAERIVWAIHAVADGETVPSAFQQGMLAEITVA
ncbi:hypothetical protein ACQEVB_40625 [Pseudonocardia sp. CA-107938]|uniref:hypothetical protein n=1 Tax=Pseudonocardia sp. CA-107938 TaxID=3240021 RepID=UPI003D93698D